MRHNINISKASVYILTKTFWPIFLGHGLSDLNPIVLAPLGKSDHTVLSFQLNCYMVTEVLKMCQEITVKVTTANYAENLALTGTHWSIPTRMMLKLSLKFFTKYCNKPVLNAYLTFPLIILQLKTPTSHGQRYAKLILIRLWTRYMETKDILKYNEYCKCRNKVRAITRKAKKEFELQVAMKARSEPNNIWNYANLKLKTRSRIPDLYDNSINGQLTSSDQDKVEVLLNFFATVYTMKTDIELPELQCKDLMYVMYEMSLPDMRRELIENLIKRHKSFKITWSRWNTSSCLKKT